MQKKAKSETAVTPPPIDPSALSLRLTGYEADAHLELSASQLLQLIMDNIPQAVFWKNRDSVYIYGNRNFTIDAGVDIVGKTDHDLAWPAMDGRY